MGIEEDLLEKIRTDEYEEEKLKVYCVDDNDVERLVYALGTNTHVIKLAVCNAERNDPSARLFVEDQKDTTEACGPMLASLPLTEFSSTNLIFSEGARPFARSIILKKLYLDKALIKDDAASEIIAENTSITDLSLPRNQLTAAAFEKLGDNTTLTFLNISSQWPSLDSSVIPFLARNKTLQIIMLNDNGITDENLEQFEECPALEEIHLNYNPVTDKGVELLSKSPALDEVSLIGAWVTTNVHEKFPNLYLETYKTREKRWIDELEGNPDNRPSAKRRRV